MSRRCQLSAGRRHTDHNLDWQHPVEHAATTAPLCPRHNRWKNHEYHVRRDPDGTWHTYGPDQSEIGRPVRG